MLKKEKISIQEKEHLNKNNAKTMIFILLLFIQKLRIEDLMMCDNWTLSSRENQGIDKRKSQNLQQGTEVSPKQPKSLKPVSFEAFQTICF